MDHNLHDDLNQDLSININPNADEAGTTTYYHQQFIPQLQHQPSNLTDQSWNGYQMNQFPNTSTSTTAATITVPNRSNNIPSNYYLYDLTDQQLSTNINQHQQLFFPVFEPFLYSQLPISTFNNITPQGFPTQNISCYGRKKLKRLRNGQPATRKRTLAACESCRLKKIKCDLTKPICGSCKKNGANCLYRATNQSNSEIIPNSPANKIKIMAGLDKIANPPKWSGCNWYSTFESILPWPIFENKFHIKSLITILSESNQNNMPEFGIFTQENLNQLSIYFQQNLPKCIWNFITNVQNKNPFMNFKKMLKSIEFFNDHSKESIYDIIIPKDLFPLPILLIIVATGLIAKPLTFKNLEKFKTSFEEKNQELKISHMFYTLAINLHSIPKYHIPDFDLCMVEFYLLKGTYWMYNLKPLKAWDCIFKSSTLIMTILESLKTSNKTFSEVDHNMLARVFHTSLKYESELKVELAFVPSSGIVNYDFQELYPSPPLDGSSLKLNEELSWFYYLTEIVLRKLENRVLDKYYIPESKPNCEISKKEKRGFKKDNHILKWELLKLNETINEISKFLEELVMIEENIQRHIKSIFEEDEDLTESILQPYGFHLNSVNSDSSQMNHSLKIKNKNKNKEEEENDDKDNIKPLSDTNLVGSVILQKLEVLTNSTRFPEVLNFIQTRMISLKMLLFRPICYIVLHHDNPGNANYNTKINITTHPFISQFLKQCNETIDLLNLPLASHRHFGSWFYLRNVLTGAILSFAIYKKLKEKFCSKEKIQEFIKNTIIIIEYWSSESDDLAEGLKCLKSAMEQFGDL